MKKHILTTAIFLLVFFQIIQAQQATSITLGQVPNNICKGSTVSLTFLANGTFDATNTFKIQIRSSYSSAWTDLVTEGSSSPLKCTIPANYDENYNYYSYYIRIVATKPSIVSTDTYISSLNSKPNLELIGVSQANINPYDAVSLLVKGSGSTPIKMVMNDSTAVSVYDISTSYTYSYTIYPAKTNEYKIAYASNVCGVGKVSGSAKLTVNEIGIKPFLTSNENVCVGGSIKVAYSANGKFDGTNKFRIGLKQNYNYYDNKEYEIDAVEKDGFIEAVIPAYIPTGIQYYARIVSSSPQAVSPWTTNTLTIAEKSSVEIASASTSIFWGKEVDIKFNYTGIGPWSVKLSDGSYIYSESTVPSNPNYQSSFSGKLKPEKTTSYAIESFSGGCGVGTPNKNVMNVTVKAGVTLDSLKSGIEVCLGESFSAKYSSNGNVGTISAVLSVNNYASGYENIKLSAVFDNGIVKVTLPKNLLNNYNSYTDNYYLGLIYSNGDEIVYSKNQIKIKALPNISLYNTTPVSLSTKGIGYIPVYVSGSGAMTITFEDSTTQMLNPYGGYNSNSYYSLPVQVVKTTSFKLKSISNTCGSVNATDTRTFTINVKNPADNDIAIKSVPGRVCVGEKVKVYFNTIGTFKVDNEYKVEFALSGGSPKVIGTGKTSPIEVTIPNTTNTYDYNYSLRVVSSTPTATSDYTYITVNTKPAASLTINTDLSRGILPNEVLSLSVNRTQGIYGSNIFVFSDGSSFQENQPYSKTFASSTNFSLKSVSNECGVGTVDSKSYTINVVPFKITPRFYYDYYSTVPYCTGNSVNYSYQISGIINAGTSFNLQIASTKDTVFKDLVTNTTDYNIRLKLPTDLPAGSYYLRLVSNTVPKQMSSLSTINIQTQANVNLTATDGTNTTAIDGDNGVVLKYDLKSGSTIINTIVTDDNGKVFRGILSYSPYNQTYNPTKATTYTLKSVDNLCGYGVGTGSVKVTIKPSFKINYLTNNTVCSGKEFTANFTSFGEFEVGNSFKITLVDNNKKRYDLTELKTISGDMKFTIPNNIPTNYYQLEVNSTKPAITKLYSSISVITPLEVVLSGNTTINPGQEAYLSIVNTLKNNYDNSGTYTLSDKSTGSLAYNYKSYVVLKPTQTTSYTLLSVSNACGVGKVSGSATITVNPVSDKTVNASMNTYYGGSSSLCSGGIQYVYYETKGTFSATNKFTAQMSDKNGDNFKDIITEGTQSPLKVTIPENLPEGDNYRIRVVASDKDVSSGAGAVPLSILASPVATLDSTTYLFTEGKSVNVKVNLTGVAPWYLKFGAEELSARTYYTATSPLVITLNPINPISYKIFGLNDSYCVGKVSGTGIVKLELVTANEELSDFEIKLFPNPTNDKVILQSDNYKHTVVQIVDNFGRKILEQDLNKSETTLDLSGYTSGQYFLQIERDNRRKIYKIQKL